MEQIYAYSPTAFAIYLWLSAVLFPVLVWASFRAKQRLRECYAVHNERFENAKVERNRETKNLAEEHTRQIEQQQSEHSKDLERYSAIISLEDELAGLEAQRKNRSERIEIEMQKLGAKREELEGEITELRGSYRTKRETYDKLKKELAIFDERLSLAELGVYEPHFDFGDSETYKDAIKEIRNEQKDMVKRKSAVYCATTWTVDGSTSKGQTMMNRATRLTLRAFNNECEAAIANTRWNNAQAMEKRIERARSAIDKLNASNSVIIADFYIEAKLKELQLTHEYRETLKRERDERAEIARQEREEKRVLQEAKAAEKEEARYQALLDKARAEIGVTTSEEHEAKIRELEAQLLEAHEKTERAKAMAEKTKSGFVYIISNIGSFGDDVIKIGLTRRLDPTDRVRELGDASVPFLFDTHAIIYSDEAPALEAALHGEFSDRRINSANMRKEFFRVTLGEVEEAVRRLAPDADFHTDIEAQEYYETLSRRKELAEMLAQQEALELPQEI